MTVTSTKRKPSVSALSVKGEETEIIGIRYSCDYCYRDISSIVRIQCAECGLACSADSPTTKTPPATGVNLEEVDLCVECFAAGVEFSGHKKTHAYRILRPLDFAIYREDWRADEELLLLEAVESNGVGNWHDIAEQLGSRTPEDCRDHFMEVYLKPYSQGESASALSPDQIARSRSELKATVAKNKRPKWNSSEEMLAAQPTPQSVPANHEIAGFMPLRGEFETECENEAENAIKDLQFTDDDGAGERMVKFAMLDIYTGVLERRSARHAFILSHGLTDFKRHQQIDKMRSKEEKEFYNSLKPFARFICAEDLQKMLDGMVKEESLRRQIAHLQELRRHGIRSFEEVNAYENERRHLELYLKGGSAIVPSNPTSTISSSAPVNKSTPSLPIKEPFPVSAAQLKKSIISASSSQSTAQPSPAPSGSGVNFVAPSPVTISIPRPASSVTGSSEIPHGAGPATIISNGGTPVPVAPASSGGRKASTPLNISHAEGVELLSEKERHLCSILRLYPRLYLSIKDTLIREYLKLGGLKRAQARGAVKIDVNKTSKLYDFFVAAGWIKPPASGDD